MSRGRGGVAAHTLLAIYGLEHDPEKWTPVFGKDHAPMENPDHDPIQLNWVMV
jgi:hypothetical protein